MRRIIFGRGGRCGNCSSCPLSGSHCLLLADSESHSFVSYVIKACRCICIINMLCVLSLIFFKGTLPCCSHLLIYVSTKPRKANANWSSAPFWSLILAVVKKWMMKEKSCELPCFHYDQKIVITVIAAIVIANFVKFLLTVLLKIQIKNKLFNAIAKLF
jgi:hypothetical protein